MKPAGYGRFFNNLRGAITALNRHYYGGMEHREELMRERLRIARLVKKGGPTARKLGIHEVSNTKFRLEEYLREHESYAQHWETLIKRAASGDWHPRGRAITSLGLAGRDLKAKERERLAKLEEQHTKARVANREFVTGCIAALDAELERRRTAVETRR